jgi:hypothetical protein
MASDLPADPQPGAPAAQESVEMPRPTAAPVVLSLGMLLLAAGAIMGLALLIAGAALLAIGVGIWVAQLLPGRGHLHERLAEPHQRAGSVAARVGAVERMGTGMPGSRLRLPAQVHPVSAGVKGGIAGGLVMPVPAVIWGLLSQHHSLWYPVNLLAGMVMPGVGDMPTTELERFQPTLLVVGLIIHAVTSVFMGLMYGVLLPTLPEIPRPLSWGGLLMPLLWSAVSFPMMRLVNPLMAGGVSWPWFIFSQLIFGVVAALVVLRAEGRLSAVPAGLLGGIVGGVLMPVPAVLWALVNRHSVWYPVNLLAGMVVPGMERLGAGELEQFHGDWLIAALGLHAGLSLGFGLVYGLLLPRLPVIPGALAWGGMLMPLLWTAVSYALMGVVNPVLQEGVNWPWFIVSQFVFGVVAALVVLRSEVIHIPPAGRGPDDTGEFLAGPSR